MSKPWSFVILLVLFLLAAVPSLAQAQTLDETSYAEIIQQEGNSPLAAILTLLEPKTIFVTSESFDGRLGGLRGADRICQDLADSPRSVVPPGEYVALLSTEAVNATARLTASSGPVIRADGTLLAGSFSEMFRGDHGNASEWNILAPPNIDELGNAVADSAWTGTNGTGLVDAGYTCEDWTSDDAGDRGNIGGPDADNAGWISGEDSQRSCDREFRLYCVKR